MDESSRSQLLTVMSSSIDRIVHALNDTNSHNGDVNVWLDRLEEIHSILFRMAPTIEINNIKQLLNETLIILNSYTEVQNSNSFIPLIYTNRRGRPAFEITKSLLEYFLENNFKGTNIADILGVSLRTLRRRMSLYNLSSSASYTAITDSELDAKLLDFISIFPNTGYRCMDGLLKSNDIKVSQIRLRESMRRVDPNGVSLRRLTLNVIQRRKYNVYAPNSLWHIDGYHKLIRWRLVIHGGIDGYSRMVVFMSCSTNNRAATVLTQFLNATRTYGLPWRVRSDRGGENIDVANYMLCHPLRGPGKGSIITGKSVHNQRIERLWRDLFTGCIHLYHTIFNYLEEATLLDPYDEIDLFCLHFVFVPRINRHMSIWKEGWNSHSLRTEKHNTPKQLWIRGSCYIQGDNTSVANEFWNSEEEISQYGVDWEGPIPSIESKSVTVPDGSFSMSEEQLSNLQENFDVLRESNCMGVDIYVELKSIVTMFAI